MIHAQDYIPQQRSVISFIVLNLTEDQVSQVQHNTTQLALGET